MPSSRWSVIDTDYMYALHSLDTSGPVAQSWHSKAATAVESQGVLYLHRMRSGAALKTMALHGYDIYGSSGQPEQLQNR